MPPPAKRSAPVPSTRNVPARASITPGSLWKELLEDQNTALGNLMAGIAIALAIIIAAAIH